MGTERRDESSYFPLFVSLAGKRSYIAGAGKIAARRAAILLSFGAEVFVTAPECSAEMEELLKGEMEGGQRLHYRKGYFAEDELAEMDLVFAATDDTVLNHEIAELCRAKGLPVNNASCQTDCDFFFPAVIKEDGLTIGISSGGSDHKKVAQVCAKLKRFFRTSS